MKVETYLINLDGSDQRLASATTQLNDAGWAFELDQANVTDQAIGRASGVRQIIAAHESGLDHGHANMKAVGIARFGFHVAAALHGGVLIGLNGLAGDSFHGEQRQQVGARCARAGLRARHQVGSA